MDRFVALAWDPANEGRIWQMNDWCERLQRASPAWQCVVDYPGFRVLALIQRGDAPVVTYLDGQVGVVVGCLFERDHEQRGRVRRLECEDALRVVATGGVHLTEAYWGSYVAIWRDPATQAVNVLRDPCGALPCFQTQTRDTALFFSHIEDIADLPGLSFTIDWDYLRAFLVFRYFMTEFTGLREVREIGAGARRQITPRGESQTRWLWSGAQIASEAAENRFESAAHGLRDVATRCFAAWGREYQTIILSLSGGLDSSILATLLRQVSSAKIVGLHYVGQGYEAFESQHARLAAAAAEIDLVEAHQDPEAECLHELLAAPRFARPKVKLLSYQVDAIARRTADRYGADAFMLGQGGDNLFIQRGSAKGTLDDYIWDHGLGPQVLPRAHDAAILQRRSVWGVLGDALSLRQVHPYGFLESDEWTRDRPLRHESLRSVDDAYRIHPWLTNLSDLPRGKAEHLRSFISLYDYHVHHGRGIRRDVVYPFISQPLVEFALRTPTYVLCQGGLDRSLERSAFRDLIPDEIFRRTGKGVATHYLLKSMKANHAFYREIILGGVLVQQGWLDEKKLSQLMSPSYVVNGRGQKYIHLLAAAEIWLQSWQHHSARAAA